MTAPSHHLDRARELTEFCLKHGGRCFIGWPIKTLFEYCFFHLIDRGVFYVRAHGGIVALLFAWGIPVDEIRQTHADKQAAFQWRRSRDHVDGIFLAEVLGDRRRLPKLFKLAAAKWPDWQRKRIFTYRAGALVELPAEVIRRMIQSPQKQSTVHSPQSTAGPETVDRGLRTVDCPPCPDTNALPAGHSTLDPRPSP